MITVLVEAPVNFRFKNYVIFNKLQDRHYRSMENVISF